MQEKMLVIFIFSTTKTMVSYDFLRSVCGLAGDQPAIELVFIRLTLLSDIDLLSFPIDRSRTHKKETIEPPSGKPNLPFFSLRFTAGFLDLFIQK